MVDMAFCFFYRIFVSTAGLESFSLRPEKFPKLFSFGGGRVRFFLLCFLKHWETACRCVLRARVFKCRNHLRVRVHSKNVGVSGIACQLD